MPRGNRYSLAGHAWHPTEQCHRQQFLLRFARDRRVWVRWLYEGRGRFGLSVPNYQVTCKHVHLLVRDRGGEALASSMQLIAGGVGHAYDRRKRRRGAFWEDRYHVTAVDTDEHLARCLTYSDLHIVRAGVVAHPRGWAAAGDHEIQPPATRYRIIDREALGAVLGTTDERLAALQNEWIAPVSGAVSAMAFALTWAIDQGVGRTGSDQPKRPEGRRFPANPGWISSLRPPFRRANGAVRAERIRQGELDEMTRRRRQDRGVLVAGGGIAINRDFE